MQQAERVTEKSVTSFGGYRLASLPCQPARIFGTKRGSNLDWRLQPDS